MLIFTCIYQEVTKPISLVSILQQGIFTVFLSLIRCNWRKDIYTLSLTYAGGNSNPRPKFVFYVVQQT